MSDEETGYYGTVRIPYEGAEMGDTRSDKHDNPTGVPVCLDCGAGNIHNRPGSYEKGPDLECGWYCDNCETPHYEVEWRQRERQSSPGQSLAKSLEEKDTIEAAIEHYESKNDE